VRGERRLNLLKHLLGIQQLGIDLLGRQEAPAPSVDQSEPEHREQRQRVLAHDKDFGRGVTRGLRLRRLDLLEQLTTTQIALISKATSTFRIQTPTHLLEDPDQRVVVAGSEHLGHKRA
jgi:hypothetical protein